MNKYTFEFAHVIEADNEESANEQFEQLIYEIEQKNELVEWFTIKKLHS